MLIAFAVTLWFLCGLVAIHVAFDVARRHSGIFDPVHIWLAVLGPISLVLACFMLVDSTRDESTAILPGSL